MIRSGWVTATSPLAVLRKGDALPVPVAAKLADWTPAENDAVLVIDPDGSGRLVVVPVEVVT